jgi:hypothetical protein
MLFRMTAQRAHVWAKDGPKTARNATEFTLARPKHEILIEIKETPMLAQNAPFNNLGAPRACQSVVLSIYMPKTRHSGRMFGRKRPGNGRNAAELFELSQPNFN